MAATSTAVVVRVKETPPHDLQNSDYDNDMEVVNLFVEAFNNPKDEETQEVVHNYLVTNLQRSWRKLKHYLQRESGAAQDLRERREVFQHADGDRRRRTIAPASTILKKLEADESLFRAHLDNLNQKFMSAVIDNGKGMRAMTAYRLTREMTHAWHLFEYIGEMFCLGENAKINPLPEKEEDEDYSYSTKFYERDIPLTNDVGHFGLNASLYGYFEDVYLVGIPIKPQYFDLITRCPGDFMHHDYDHNLALRGHRAGFKNEWKEAYYRIFSTTPPLFKPLEQELVVMHMWCIIHETVLVNRTKGVVSNATFFHHLLSPFTLNLIVDFHTDYNRFYDVVLTHPALADLKTTFPTCDPAILHNYYDSKLVKEMVGESDKEYTLETTFQDVNDVIQTGWSGRTGLAAALARYLMVHWVGRALLAKLLESQ